MTYQEYLESKGIGIIGPEVKDLKIIDKKKYLEAMARCSMLGYVCYGCKKYAQLDTYEWTSFELKPEVWKDRCRECSLKVEDEGKV